MRTILLLSYILTFNQNLFSQEKQDLISKTKWLVGSWKGKDRHVTFYEAWRVQGDSLVNYTIDIKGTDTVLIEQTSLRARSGQIVFGKSGGWILKRLTQTEIVLENDTSKFSNRMIYLHLKNDRWFALLEHPKSTMYYDMERISELDGVVDNLLRKRKMQ